MVGGVAEEGLLWLSSTSIEKVLQSSRGFDTVVVFEDHIQDLQDLGETFSVLGELFGTMFNLSPCNALQGREQVDRASLVLF